MAKKLFLLIVIFAVLWCNSCSTVRQLRPLNRGQSAVSASVGGPITRVGSAYIPLPLLSVGYNYGLINQMLDVEAGVHLTQAVYSLMQLEIGANYRPWLRKRFRPGLMVTPKFFFVTNFQEFKFYPDLGLTLQWQPKQYWYIYTGLDNFFELSKTRHDGNTQNNHWFIVPYLGIDMGNKRWGFQFEPRIYIPNLSNGQRAVKNFGLGDHGILGLFIGAHHIFERKGKP
jgi:hypothetical protein